MSRIKGILENLQQSNAEAENGLTPETGVPDDGNGLSLVDPNAPPQQKPQQDPRSKMESDGLRASANVASQAPELKDEMLAKGMMGGTYVDSSQETYSDPEAWSADRVYQNFFETSGENIIYGLGTMVESWGDVAQALGGLFADDWDGNVVSRILHENAEELQNSHLTKLPPGIMDPEFKLSTFMDPNFWSTHGARFVPQLAEILATFGAAYGVRKGAGYGAKKLLKEVAEKSGKKTTKAAYRGAAGKTTEIAGTGKGIIGKVMTDQGKFTKNFSQLLETTTAGTLTNLRVSLANAGEMYNTYAGAKDENGNPIFNEQELGEMAAGAFTNNMQYLGLDILSWGMTFGRGNIFRQLGLSNRMTRNASENMTAAFKKTIRPIIRKPAALGLKMSREGAEEMIQESFEEWSKMESYRDQYGSLEGYEGKVTEAYKRGIPGFIQYLQSSDSEAIRTIAFGMGAMAAGTFNVKTLINKEADKTRKMQNRLYAFDQYTQDLDDTQKGMHRDHMYSQIAEIVFDGKGEAFAGFVNRMQENGNITQEEVEHYTDVFDRLSEDAEAIQALNIKGKRAMMHYTSMEKYFEDDMAIQQEAHNKRLEWIMENTAQGDARDSAIKQEMADFEKEAGLIAYGLAETKLNKQRILNGRRAKKIKFKKNENPTGNESEQQVVVPENFKSNPQLAQIYQEQYQRALEVMPEENVEIDQESAMQQAAEDPAGFMQSLAEGSQVIIDEEQATVNNVEENIGGQQDVFSYTINPKEGDPDATTDEELKSRQGTVRLTKKGTFFDDRTNKKSEVGPYVKPTAKAKAKPESNEETGGREAMPDNADETGQTSMNFDQEEETTEFNAGDKEFYDDIDNVKYQPKRKNLTKKTYERFQETGEIPSGVLMEIGKKLAAAEDLTAEEMAVATAHFDTMQKVIKYQELDLKQKTDASSLDEKTQNYIEKASQRPAKKTTLQILKSKASEAAKKVGDKVKKLSEKTRKTAKEIIQGGPEPDAEAKADKATKKVNDQAKEALGKDEQAEGTTQTNSFMNRIKTMVSGIGNSLVETADGVLLRAKNKRAWKNSHLVSDLHHMNSALEKVFPDVAPRAYVIENLEHALGSNAFAYAVGSGLFFNPTSWQQDEIVQHEIAHIWYAISADTPETKKLMTYALQNKELVDHIKKVYAKDTYYIFNQGGKKYRVRQKNIGPILNKNFNRMNRAGQKQVIQAALDSGKMTELPLAQQPIISEEIFVANLQGHLSKKYDRFFNERRDAGRQGRVKRWWQAMVDRVAEARGKNPTWDKSLKKVIDPKDFEDYELTKQEIVDGWKEATKGMNINAGGREAINQEKLANTASEILETRARRIKNQEKFVGKPLKPEGTEVQEILEEEAFMQETDTFDPDAKFQKDGLRYVEKAGQLIRAFNTAYGIAMNKRFFYRNQGRVTNWRKMPVYDGDLLKIQLFDMAQAASSADHFINMIDESEIEEIFEFNEFLKDTREDKDTFLASLYHFNKNHHFINGVKLFVNNDGTLDVQSSLNNRENSVLENQKRHLIRQIGAGWSGRGSKQLVSNFENYKAAADRIRANNFTDNDIRTVLEFFGGRSINIDKMMERGNLNYKGRTYTIDEMVYAFLSSPYGIGEQRAKLPANAPKGAQAAIIANKDSAYIKGGKTLRKGVQDFLEALIVSNRPFTAEYTTQDANGMLKPAREVNNMLFTMIGDMKNDVISGMGRNTFLSKYGRVTRGLKTGKQSNKLLGKIYDDIKSGRDVGMNIFDGIVNQNTGNTNTLKGSNATEHSFSELSIYMASLYPNNRKTPQASYVMELGRMSDSPRAFMIEAPHYKSSEIMKSPGVIDTKKPAIQAAYAISKNAGFEGTIEEYTKALQNAMTTEVEFLESQYEYAKNLNQFKGLYKENGKLNRRGKEIIADYVMNQHLNGVFFMEAFLPSYQGANLVKRAKSLTSPYFGLQDNNRLEAIPILDPKNENGVQSNDGAMYMLAEDIARLRKLGGNIMDIRYGIKGVHAGVEHTNSKFAGRNLYNKGYIFSLDEEVVAKNPDLKGVYRLLKARKELNKKRSGGEYEEDLQSDLLSHLPYAYHVSADKANMIQGQEWDRNSSMFDLKTIDNTPEANAFLDKQYYNGDQFVGLSGRNFGVQLTMDKENTSSTVSVQLMKAITTNAAINDNMEVAERLQGYLTALMQQELAEIDEVFTNGTTADIRKLITSYMNIAEMDQIQAQSIQLDKLSLHTPELRMIARNQIANIVRLKGNKMKAPGTIAQQMPDTYGKPYITGGNNKLAYYAPTTQKELDHIEMIRKVRVGNRKKSVSKSYFRTGTKPSEAVVPAFMEGQGIRPRKYFTLDTAKDQVHDMKRYKGMNRNNKLAVLRDMAIDVAGRRRTKVGIAYNSQGVIEGFYAEGDTILATRIPAHGPQTTGVFEVIDFHPGNSSNIQTSEEFALKVTGGDFDGDQLFVQHARERGGKPEWRQFVKGIAEYWLTPEMQREVKIPIDHKSMVDEAKEKVPPLKDQDLFMTPEKRRQDFQNTRSTAESIGIVANAHSLIGMLSAYNATFKGGFSVNGNVKTTFQDMEEEGASRTITSANIFQIVLDNAKDQSAQQLGINKQTATIATILVNLGYKLSEVAPILRSDVVEYFVKMKSEKENNFSSFDKSSDVILREVKKKFKIKKSDSLFNIDTEADLNSEQQQAAIFQLLERAEGLNGDFIRLSGLLSQHNAMEINPFQLQQQINDFEEAVNNRENKYLVVPQGFAMNPVVQNYQNTAGVLLRTLQKLDPVYRPKSAKLYEILTEAAPKTMSKNQKEHLYNAMETFHTARSMGFNNIPKAYLDSLVNPKSENNLYNRLYNHIEKMKKNIVVYNESDPLKSISELDASLLFSKMLSMNFFGQNQYVGLNSSWYKENVDKQLKERAIQEFNALPTDLKNDLILHDLMVNGFKGAGSIFPILPDDFRQRVSVAADQDVVQKNTAVIDDGVMSKLLSNILKENEQLSISPTPDIQPFKTIKGKQVLNYKFLDKNPKIRKQVMNGKPFFVQGIHNGKKSIFYFRGGSNFLADAKLLYKNTDESKKAAVADVAFKHTSILPINDTKYNQGIIAIPDETTSDPYFMVDNQETVDSWETWIDSQEDGGREAIPEQSYWKYTSKLERSEFDGVMNYDLGVDEDQKSILYAGYEKDYQNAEAASQVINEETVKEMDDKQLTEHWEEYGKRDKFAYAKVMNPITMELAQRATLEQVNEYNGNQYDGKDLSIAQKWMMSNNIPSNHPGSQAAVRRIEKAYKEYQVERTRMVSQINKATDALYQEKFGFKLRNQSWKDTMKALFQSIKNLFKRDDFYKELYGNLIIVEKQKDKVGRDLTKIRYKPKEQIEQEFAEGKITKAEYDFYNVTTAIAEEMKPYVVTNGQGRADFVPHVAPDLLEKYARRGLLGTMVHAKNFGEQIYDVKMSFTHPGTGNRVENVTFKYIEDVYNAVSANKKAPLRHTKDFVALKRKAYKLYKSGKNEDGSNIRFTNLAIGTAIGDVFMNEFSGSNGANAQDLPSLDLNKAFTEYVGSTLFTNGNANFAGMKKLLPVFDGLLAQAHRDKNPNLEKYLEGVWRNYFLKGSKKQTLPNSASLMAIGVSTDEVVDFLTKGSLIYWLGYKGLAIGAGAYAIGNVLVGKYHNVKNAGGKAWAKGEKRFWYGKTGNFKISDPMRGVKETAQILKNIGFLDINVYDEIHASKKNSFDTMLSNIALAPMIHSEKWIQGVHFLGMLTNEEWDHIKNGGRLNWDRLNELENEVKKSHGKGYQPTDQRLVQMYSWGRAVMQFSRYLPTMVYDRLAKKDIDRYGNIHVGAYRAMWEPIQKMIHGQMKPGEFKEWYKGLTDSERQRFNAGVSGFGFMALLLGSQQVLGRSEYANDLFWDSNAIADYEKLKWKTVPPSIAMVDQLTNF